MYGERYRTKSAFTFIFIYTLSLQFFISSVVSQKIKILFKPKKLEFVELKKYIDETTTSTTTVPTTTPRPTTGLKLNCPHHNVKLAEPRKGFRWQGKVANWEACAERCRKIKDCQYWQYWGAQVQT